MEWKGWRALMEKHIQLAGIFNIVYRSITLLGGFFLFFLAAGFWQVFDYLVRIGAIVPHEIPMEILNIVPIILCFIACMVTVVSILGIIAGVGVLKRREWGRILLLVVSFFNLIRIPFGTAVGVYTLWVLLNSDVIKLFTKTEAPAAA
jgi:hypothetical protein